MDANTDDYIKTLDIKTEKGSKSFANPSITPLTQINKDGKRKKLFIISMFLPMVDCTGKGELGELIYVVDAKE
jgi:hypothetical protein